MGETRKDYRTGDPKLDSVIDELASLCSSGEAQGLLEEILTSVVKLGTQTRDKGDLKLVNSVLKELRYSFKIFSPPGEEGGYFRFGQVEERLARIPDGGSVRPGGHGTRLDGDHRRRAGDHGGRQ